MIPTLYLYIAAYGSVHRGAANTPAKQDAVPRPVQRLVRRLGWQHALAMTQRLTKSTIL